MCIRDRVHDVLLVANRRLEEASITEGERVNVFIYQVFAFPAGENGTQNVNIVENANIESSFMCDRRSGRTLPPEQSGIFKTQDVVSAV